MGMFVSTAAFRRKPDMDWAALSEKLEQLFTEAGDVCHDLGEERTGYGTMSVYGGMGAEMAETAKAISLATGDYAVAADCVDSDFAVLTLYHGGNLVEQCVIGSPYDEFDDVMPLGKPDVELWKPLLLDPEKVSELQDALLGNAVFVEEQLAALSRLTGVPVFDEALLEQDEWE